MPLDIVAKLARLRAKTTVELLTAYREVFGRRSASRNRLHLIRQIAWGLQADVQFSLSQIQIVLVAT